MEALIAWAVSDEGAGLLWIQVLADNLPAVSLYRSLGFEAIYTYRYWQQGTAGRGT
jgi:ribosomal protein S18 acetylase RimI-like enzyme